MIDGHTFTEIYRIIDCNNQEEKCPDKILAHTINILIVSTGELHMVENTPYLRLSIIK